MNQLPADLQRWRSWGDQIALCVPSETLAVRYGGQGQPLDWRGAPIHAGH